MLGGSHIILSTIGMLSNPILEDNGAFHCVPVRTLVIDEASQINIFEYMVRTSALLWHTSPYLFFGQPLSFPKLKKVCFFGDPQQCNITF